MKVRNSPRVQPSITGKLATYGARCALVRFEDSTGVGLFSLISQFEDWIEGRHIRLNRRDRRTVLTLITGLRNATRPPALGAYDDTLSRSPVTWFRASAANVVKEADRLVRVLNRLGADIRRVESDRPPPILWEDDIQVITRRPRRASREQPTVVQSRQIDRRKRLQRIRSRAGRKLARRLKGSRL